MKMFRILSLAALAVVFVLSSCSKYEEGPLVSLRTKKARITGEWKVEKYVDEDGGESDPNSFDADSRLELTEDNEARILVGSDELGSGSWEFKNSKESLMLDISIFGIPAQSGTQRILKLKNDEMWLAEEDDIEGENYGGYTVYTSVE
ncbi:MAG: hypothetical protein ACQERC_04890 [Bacteroidota bacterium]